MTMVTEEKERNKELEIQKLELERLEKQMLLLEEENHKLLTMKVPHTTKLPPLQRGDSGRDSPTYECKAQLLL